MDPPFKGFTDSVTGYSFGADFIFTDSDQSQALLNDFKLTENAPTLNFMDPPLLPPDPDNLAATLSLSSEGDSSDDIDFSDTVLKYISQMLMEEDMEEKPCMFNDPLALQAAEKPFYELLGKDYQLSVESPDYSSNSTNSSGNNSFFQSFTSENTSHTTSQSDPQWLLSSSKSFGTSVTYGTDSVNSFSVQNLFSDDQSVLQFNRGVEEASKFLPISNPLLVDLDTYKFTSGLKKEAPELIVKTEKHEREYSPNGSRGRKNHHHEDIDLEDGRSSKQSAVYVEEEELSEMFDQVLLCPMDKHECPLLTVDGTNGLHQNGYSSGSNAMKMTRNGKRGSKKEVVDLRSLLIQCAQAVAADDRRTANEQLKQIRQHSSPFGDGNQRMAHYFANSLEARLAGTGTQLYTAHITKRNSAAQVLKAYQLYLQACPFKKMAIIFANHRFLKAAEQEKTLHIIDFGILYGFQWPILIKLLSQRVGGPPKLRITGIELPQPGFRPAERVEETGRRLAKYCERFKVPFEYNAIAQKWETIQIEDLKIEKDEVLVVNCLFRFKNLLDETIVVDNPRDTVLTLIRNINPKLFVQAIVNGTFNAPFFVTRFREALFHYSALFDMLDTATPRDDQERFWFEKEFYGRELMNVIACEGTERVERPETYKQWQVRNMRAGFKQIDLEKEGMKKLRHKMKAYHEDFLIDEDNQWILLGWKGRITYATSAWVPA